MLSSMYLAELNWQSTSIDRAGYLHQNICLPILVWVTSAYQSLAPNSMAYRLPLTDFMDLDSQNIFGW